MNDSQTLIIDISQLRPGMHIHLDLGWMSAHRLELIRI